LSGSLEASTSWIPQGLHQPLQELFELLLVADKFITDLNSLKQALIVLTSMHFGNFCAPWIIIIFIYCNLVVTRWQWLFSM